MILLDQSYNDKSDYTALQHASRNGDLEMVSFLLETPNYPVHHVSKMSGLSAFQLAIVHRHEHVVMKFIEFLSEISNEDVVFMIDNELLLSFSAAWVKFHVFLTHDMIGAIIASNNQTLFQFMTAKTSNLLFYLQTTFETPYMLAICFENTTAIKFCRLTGQAIMAGLVKLTPNIIKHHYSYILFLIKSKVSITIEDDPYFDPLVLFIQYYGMKRTSVLVNAGFKYRSAYHQAVKANDIWLINKIYHLYPECIDHTDHEGNTPLMNSRSSFISRHLIQLGALVFRQNIHGESALFMAARSGNLYLVRVLREAKLSPKHYNNEVRRAIHYIPATSRFFKPIFDLLS